MSEYKKDQVKLNGNKEGHSVQAVDRALHLLKVIGEYSKPVSVSEISKRTGLNRTTVWRLVGSLENQGFVEKDHISNGYQVGYAIYQLISQNDLYGPLIRRAHKTLVELKEESGETVLLSVPKHNGVLTIDQINPDHTIRLLDYSNRVSPLHCSSNGKILLSMLPEEDVNFLLNQPLIKYSKHTITDPIQLRKELEKIRKEKVGISLGELDESENAISAPIFDRNQKLVAFITIGGPSFRFQEKDLMSLKIRILEAAKQIGILLN